MEYTNFQEIGLNPQFDPLMNNVQIVESVKWLNNFDDLKLSQESLTSWQKWGQRKTRIDDENNFCDNNILQEILTAKSSLDQISRFDLEEARAKCNAFDTMKCSIFQNRSAVKVANIDARLDFMFSNPKNENGESLVNDGDILHFADICGGPGGFSEYLLWRNEWQAKGFGFTLRDAHDFNLHAFFASKTETFNRFYGIKGDGNILDPENIKSLQNYVLNQRWGYLCAGKKYTGNSLQKVGPLPVSDCSVARTARWSFYG